MIHLSTIHQSGRRALMIVPLAMMFLLLAAAPASAQERTSEQIDRELYHQLTSRLRQIDRDYARVVDQAMRQARAGDGQADLELQARMLSLREARDRTMSRLLLVSTRHGWEIPDFDESGEAASGQESESPTARVFAPAAQIVHGRFAAEALAIVRGLRLPVISLPPAPSRER